MKVLGKAAEQLKSLQVIAASLLALAAFTGSVGALTFGSGREALAQAIDVEAAARDRLLSDEKALNEFITASVCDVDPAERRCEPRSRRNDVHIKVEKAVGLSSNIEIERILLAGNRRADRDDPSLADIETNLILSIAGLIKPQLDTEVPQAVIAAALGNDFRYAADVYGLAIARGDKRFLEHAPELVEPPHWWRDPVFFGSALAGGLAFGLFLQHFDVDITLRQRKRPGGRTAA